VKRLARIDTNRILFENTEILFHLKNTNGLLPTPTGLALQLQKP